MQTASQHLNTICHDTSTEKGSEIQSHTQLAENDEPDVAGGEPGDGNELDNESGGVQRRRQLQPAENNHLSICSNVAGGDPGGRPSRPKVYLGERVVDVDKVLQLKSIVDNICKEYDEKNIQYVLEAVIAGDKVCKVCNTVLHNTPALRAHIKSKHMKTTEFTCERCNKNFGSKSTMKLHMRKHREDARKFACEFCEKTFTAVGRRNEHRKSHFINARCKYSCGKTFNTTKNRNTHERVCHQQPGGKAAIEKISCLYCAKTFIYKKDANRHIRMKHPSRAILE